MDKEWSRTSGSVLLRKSWSCLRADESAPCSPRSLLLALVSWGFRILLLISWTWLESACTFVASLPSS